MRFPILVTLLLATPGLAGCDSAVGEGEVVVLTVELASDVNGRPVRFTFESDSLQTGRLTDITCGCRMDVGDFLADRGFERADISSAEVRSARLRMLFPIQEQLNFLDQAILKLKAPGISVTEIAEQEVFPESAEATLNPRQGRDVAGFLDQGTFEPLLQIDANRLIGGREYEIGLVLTFRLEMVGF